MKVLDYINFALSTFTYVMLGTVIGDVFLHKKQEYLSLITVEDYFNLGYLYIIFHLVRLFVLSLLYPLSKKYGYGMSIKKVFVMAFNNLKDINTFM